MPELEEKQPTPEGGVEQIKEAAKAPSLDDLLEITKGVEVDQGIATPQEGEARPAVEVQPQGEKDALQERIKELEEHEKQSREFIERMRKELETIQAEKKKQETTRGKLQYYVLTNQRNKLQEGLKSLGLNPDYYLKPGEKIKTVEYGTQGWKKRAEQPIGSPEQFLKQVQMDTEEAQKREQEAPPIEPYYEKFKQDKGEMFLQKGPYANEEEAKAAFDLFNEKVWATGRNDKVYFQHWVEGQRRTLEGFTQAALESNDLETAIAGFDIAGELDNPEIIGRLREKTLALKESQDPKERGKLVKASQLLQEIKSRKEAESQIQ